MPKKPPTWDQSSSLFPITPDDSREPPHPLTATRNGDTDAVQDHSPRTPEGKDGVARSTASNAPAPADGGDLGREAEDQPRHLEGDARPGESGQPREPDRERSPGNGAQGA